MLITEYKTGWDYSIKGNRIEAHAPSHIRLKCTRSQSVSITPMIKENGDKKTHPKIIIDNVELNGVEYGKQYKIDVREGSSIELLFPLAANVDKSKSWNYWLVDELHASFAESYLDKHSHLGDSLAFLIGLENIGSTNNKHFKVCRNQIYLDILRCFDFRHVSFTEQTNEAICLDYVFDSASWSEPWLERLGNSISKVFGFRNPQTYRIPQCKVNHSFDKDNSICCQFDCRSSKNLDKEIITKIVDIYSENYTVKIIGGKDSTEYLGHGYTYSFGDLEHIIKELSRCDFFLGVDSGIAHLAGIFGIRSYIINLIEQDTAINLFRYKNTRFVDRRFITDVVSGNIQNTRKLEFDQGIKVIAMRRSGMHPIINWMAFQFKSALFINDTHENNPDIFDADTWSFIYRDGKRSHTHKRFQSCDCLIYNYEDKDINQVINSRENVSYKNKLIVLILRNPYNLMASRLKKGFDLLYQMWLEHARIFVENDSIIKIYYDKWFIDPEYRKMKFEQIRKLSNIEMIYSDEGMQEVLNFGGGSSFDGFKFHGSAQKMNVLGRFDEIGGQLKLPIEVIEFWNKYREHIERT